MTRAELYARGRGSPYSRTRNKQVVRILRVLRLIQTGRRSLDELSRELSISPRTIRRDLAAIQEAHLAIRRTRGEDDTWRWSVA